MTDRSRTDEEASNGRLEDGWKKRRNKRKKEKKDIQGGSRWALYQLGDYGVLQNKRRKDKKGEGVVSYPVLTT